MTLSGTEYEIVDKTNIKGHAKKGQPCWILRLPYLTSHPRWRIRYCNSKQEAEQLRDRLEEREGYSRRAHRIAAEAAK